MMDVPFHDQQAVYGVSEDCKFNCHNECRSVRCGCSCHRSSRVEADRQAVDHVMAAKDQPSSIQTGLDKYCPKCKLKANSEQNFCKVDGTRLSSLRCPECGTPGDQEDNFCGYCGASMKVTDRQLEAAATGIPVAEVIEQSPIEAEALMRAAMAAKQPVAKVASSSKISVGMFK